MHWICEFQAIYFSETACYVPLGAIQWRIENSLYTLSNEKTTSLLKKSSPRCYPLRMHIVGVYNVKIITTMYVWSMHELGWPGVGQKTSCGGDFTHNI